MTTMAEYNYDSMRRRECEELIPRLFHVHLPVKRFVCDDIETGSNSYAVLFESGKDLYALLVDKQDRQTFADVRRMTKRMGLRVDRFFPPGADPRYFFEEGVKLYQQAYPAKKQWSKDDIPFYASQAVYSPALVRVTVVDDGLYRYSTNGGSWQRAFDFTFRKVRVS